MPDLAGHPATAHRGHADPSGVKGFSTHKVLHGPPWQIGVFSPGMYRVVCGLRNAGLTDRIAGLLDALAQGGIWGAALETGVLTALLATLAALAQRLSLA